MSRYLSIQPAACWRSCWVVMALACVAVQAAAQQDAAPPAAKAQPPQISVGDATQGLLSLQRSNSNASSVPRPITGDVASRSYQRYLKSFEHPIPEKFNTTVKTSSGGAGGPSN